MSRRRFGVLNFKLRYGFRILYFTVELVTMFTEDYCMWDSELVENISLRELQPPQLRKIIIIYVIYYMLFIVSEFVTCAIWQYSAAFFFLSFSSLSFFFLVFFFLCCLLRFTRFQFYLPLVLTIAFTSFFLSL